MAEQKKIDVVIPAYKPGEKFQKLIKMLQKQTYPIHEILIMNTEKAYFPEASVAGLPNVRVEHLTRAEFDHGGTRDKAAGLLSGDFFLFMTQDAVPADTYLVEKLAGAFDDEKVDAAYARQLPNPDCSVIERYTRSFNYPDAPSVKTKKDLPKYGIKTFFCSNVCAMYRAETYWRLGGFEKKTIFNEDMIFAGKIILNGGGIAYVPEARVIHSHNYGNIEQLRRNFDLAVSQTEHPEIFTMASSESEGMKLVKQTTRYLIKSGHPWLIPELVIKSGFNFIGYRLGKAYQKLPRGLVKRLSMNKSYWEK